MEAARGPLFHVRVLVVVANDGRPHAICADCFGSSRQLGAVHWLENAQAAAGVLASGQVDLAVLDDRCESDTLLAEIRRLRRAPAVILLGDATSPLADGPTPVACLDRDAFSADDLVRAIAHVLAHTGRAWLIDRGHDLDDRASHSDTILDGVIRFPQAQELPAREAPTDDRAGTTDQELLQRLPVVLGRLDREGRILQVGGAGLSRAGLDAERLVGQPFVGVFPAGRQALRAALAGEAAHFEICLTRETTNVRCMRFEVFPHAESDGAAVGWVAQEIPIERSTGDEVLRAVDSERHRIGADLHDEVGQLLTGITCLSKVLVERLRGRDDLAAEDAHAIAETAKEALAQIRSLAHGLAPVQLSRHGLASALEEFAALIQRMHHVDLHLDLPRHPAEMDAETVTHVFRIIQEAVANAVRHGQASEISVSLRRMGALYQLAIADNGCGFDESDQSHGTGAGLRLMEYRAALMRGSLHIASHVDRGTRVEVSFTPSTSRTHETAC